MEWKESYKIGVEVVDRQHKKLFQMINDFEEILNEEQSDAEKRNKCRNAIIFMKAYVIMHFSDEEKYQESIGYEGFLEHQKIHQDFTAQIQEYEKRLEESNYDLEIVTEFGIVLENWLIRHVSQDDQKIKKK